jgi:hypothetical protein
LCVQLALNNTKSQFSINDDNLIEKAIIFGFSLIDSVFNEGSVRFSIAKLVRGKSNRRLLHTQTQRNRTFIHNKRDSLVYIFNLENSIPQNPNANALDTRENLKRVDRENFRNRTNR